MTRIGWLADEAGYVGGAELTTAEFRAAAPEGVEIVDCPPGAVVKGLDAYVIQNCVLYTPKDLERTTGSVTKFWHDVGPHLQPGVREWLNTNAKHICCSPVQAEYMGLDDAVCIPPPVDLARFEAAAAEVNGSRSGVVSVGQWRNYGKAPHRVAEWARGEGCEVDFFGAGVFAPHGSKEVAYDAMPALLAQYRTFVHLPIVIEPFGRLVAEAHAAGCEIVTNNLVGAKYWITENPDGLYTAGEDFWRTVLA